MTEALARLTAALADRYRVERELGQGGMATVYLAEDLKHGRKVAIKVLRPELAAVIGAERFVREIRTIAALQHPHILGLIDSGEVQGTAYYVMPFVEGESLRDRLTREKQLPIADAVRIATEVAGALDYAHRHNVIHRDIKPENILVHDGQALVADFGIALAASKAGGTRMTETGMSLGTPTYMSPEQAMGEREITARSDVYALGCVTYEMLLGEPPFTGPTAQAIVAKVMTERPAPPSKQRDTIPEGVEDAVLTALAKLPADRFASAAEFAAALAGSTRTVGRPSFAGTGTHLPTRLSILLATLALTTALALGWGAWETFRPRPAPDAPITRFALRLPLDRNASGSVLAITRDGSRIVIVTRPPGELKNRLMLRRLDRSELTPIPGPAALRSPFFSPDGEWVGFANDQLLRKVRLDGSGLTTIADLGPGGLVNECSWGPTGEIVFADRLEHLYRVSSDGGAPVRIAPGDGANYITPSWLPDGERFLAARRAGEGLTRDMIVLSAASGSVLANLGPGYIPRYVSPGFLVWLSQEGRLLAAPFDQERLRLLGSPVPIVEGLSSQARSIFWTVAENGALAFTAGDWADKQLLLVSSGGAATMLPLGPRAFRGPRFSPDGRRIAVDVEPGGDLLGDIWIFDRGPGTFTRVTLEGTSVFPEWTPDGRAIVYSTGVNTARNLLRVPADRSGPPVVLVKGPPPVFEGSLTPDGKTLIYRVIADSTGRDIYVLSPGGRSTPFAAGPFAERSAALSKDGRLVLYVTNESGRDEVYVRPLDGQGRAQVSGAGGIEPRWGPGDRIAYYRWQDTLFAAPILPGLAVGARRIALAGSYVSEANHANYDVAPDGSGFVFVRSVRADAASEVTVLLNWFASLSRPDKR